MAIRVLRHTSNICGCITWVSFFDTVPLASMIHTDIALSPCKIHDSANYGLTLLADDAGAYGARRVRGETSLPIRVIEVGSIRPSHDRRIVFIPETAAFRGTAPHRLEMFRKEDAKGVLSLMPEFGVDGPNGRQFRVEPEAEFDADRNMTIVLNGFSAADKAKARLALGARAVVR